MSIALSIAVDVVVVMLLAQEPEFDFVLGRSVAKLARRRGNPCGLATGRTGPSVGIKFIVDELEVSRSGRHTANRAGLGRVLDLCADTIERRCVHGAAANLGRESTATHDGPRY